MYETIKGNRLQKAGIRSRGIYITNVTLPNAFVLNYNVYTFKEQEIDS